MSQLRARRIKVGVFLAVAGAAVVATALTLGGLHFWRSTDTYRIGYRATVSGLELGAPVKVRGVRVGEVTGIGLTDEIASPVEVTIEVEGGTPIHRGARAHLVRVGITDLKFIDIRGGELDAPRFRPGDEIPGQDALLERYAERAEDLLDDAEQLSDNLVALTGPETREPLTAALERAAASLAAIESAAARIEKAAAQAEALVAETRAGVGETRQRIDSTLEAADALIAEGRRAFDSGKGDARVALDNLRVASQEIKELSRTLRRSPSRILFQRPPRERDLP